jgi:hypothetical protein
MESPEQKYFVFACELRLREANPYRGELLGGHSHTWVRASSIDLARERLVDLFADDQWQIEKIVHEFESDLSCHPWNHKESQPNSEMGGSLHQAWLQLHKFGIGSEICAYREKVNKEA